jgi:hypothetical protein
MYSLYLHGFFFYFFIWNIKVLNIFFNFSGLTNETQDPASWPDQSRTGFNNYGQNMREGDCQVHACKDINSPYYLHPLDSPWTIFMPCDIYAGNYPTWKRAMKNTHPAKKKISFVEGH